MLVVAFGVVLTGAAGYAAAAALGHRPGPTWPIVAGGISVVAGVLAVLPVNRCRGASQAEVARASLMGMVVQMLVSLVGALVVLVGMKPDAAFGYWMLGFFWATLLFVSAVMVGASKAARVEAKPGRSEL